MKYEKLKRICKRKKLYSVLGACCIIPLLLLFFLTLAALAFDENVNISFVMGVLVISIVMVVVAIVLGRLEHNQGEMIENYIAIRIMDVVNVYGIASNKFELIQETSVIYKIAFHNQMVDYQKLQAMIDEEIDTINKITGDATRVKLI